MKKRILTVPHEVLRKKSVEVQLTEDTRRFVKDLEETLQKKDKPQGVGLSAPQVGKNINIFSMFLPDNMEDSSDIPYITTFINPVILKKSTERSFGTDPKDPVLEGCLSIPSMYGPVPRHEWIHIGYTKPDGTKVEKIFRDFHARVIQHEYDHLEGILFTDYIIQLDLPLYKFYKNSMVEVDNSIAKAF